MKECKLVEKILARNNRNTTGGHDPDVARHLLKAGPLPNQGSRRCKHETLTHALILRCSRGTEYHRESSPRMRSSQGLLCQFLIGTILTISIGRSNQEALEQTLRLLLHVEPPAAEPSGDGNQGGAEVAHRPVGGRLLPGRNG